MASNHLNELVGLIGMDACLAIARAYGGRTVRVPMRPTNNHPFLVTIGAVATDKLCKEYGGVHIEIPVHRTALLLQRNVQIVREVLGGAKITTTAHKYGLSRKMIRKIMASPRLLGAGPTHAAAK